MLKLGLNSFGMLCQYAYIFFQKNNMYDCQQHSSIKFSFSEPYHVFRAHLNNCPSRHEATLNISFYDVSTNQNY